MTVRPVRSWVHGPSLLLSALVMLFCAGARGDEIVKVNGIKLTGTVFQQSPNFVKIRIEFGGSPVEIRVAVKDIHMITVDGSKRVLHERNVVKPRRRATVRRRRLAASRRATLTQSRGSTAARSAKKTAPDGTTRTRAQVAALIDRMGRTRPDWWNATPLKVPPGLDLTWRRPSKGWNARKWLGQYIWSIINENPRKWKEGIRLLHHTLAVNKGDASKVRRSMNALGATYAELLGDWARAAFWWRKGGGGGHGYGNNVALALCYWKLGNKPLAVETLTSLGSGTPSRKAGRAIKLWADLGYLKKALQMAEQHARGRWPGLAYRVAGDACRQAGRYQAALAYYQKVLDQGRDKWHKDRARAAIAAIKLYETMELKRVADGTYASSSLGYAGQVSVDVSVKRGKILSVKVTRHKEKQFYSSITDTPKQIVERQGIRGVDAVTGATLTSNAIINATAKALLSGMK